MKKDKLITIGILAALSVHLFLNNAGLLNYITPDQYEKTFFSYIKAISYGLITVLIVWRKPKLYFVIPFAILDGFGVFAYINNGEDWNKVLNLYGSVYFGVYTFFIILFFGMIQNEKTTENKDNREIETLLKEMEKLKTIYSNLLSDFRIIETQNKNYFIKDENNYHENAKLLSENKNLLVELETLKSENNSQNLTFKNDNSQINSVLLQQIKTYFDNRVHFGRGNEKTPERLAMMEKSKEAENQLLKIINDAN